MASEFSAGPARIQYWRAYRYVFDNPNWAVNLLLGALCHFSGAIIPIVGPLLYMGYLFEVVEALHLRKSQTYPDFDFNRFADYLGRAVWPFLVSLIVGLLMVPVLLAVFFVCLVGGIAVGSNGDEAAAVAFVLFTAIGVLLTLLLSVVMSVIVTPMMLRSGLAQEFGQGFNVAWIKDFIRRVGMDLVKATVFLLVTGIVLVILGMLCCYIGMFVAIPWLQLAQFHIMFQVYELYLARGGEKIPLKPQQPLL